MTYDMYDDHAVNRHFNQGDDEPAFDYLTESARTASGDFHGHLVALSEIEEAFKDFIAATAKMDRIKKLLFYGEDVAKGRVSNCNFHYHNEPIANAAINALPTYGEDSEYLLHATLGTATEAGEMVEHLYDVIFEGKTLDLINMREEVFDGQWYHAMFCRVAGITFDQGQRENIAKLRKRFPDKFTTEAANVRDLDAERAVLEGNALSEAQKANILFGAVGDAAQHATRFNPVDGEGTLSESNSMYPPAIAGIPMEVEDFATAYAEVYGTGYHPSGEVKHGEQVFAEAVAKMMPASIRELESPPSTRPLFTEAEGFLLEAATQIGFQWINGNADIYVCTQNALLDLTERVAQQSIRYGSQAARNDENAVQLVAPDGWFLHRAAHEHTAILYRGDIHEPLPHAAGPWVVEFQRYPSGGLLTAGRGKDLCEAWVNAVKAVEARAVPEENGE